MGMGYVYMFGIFNQNAFACQPQVLPRSRSTIVKKVYQAASIKIIIFRNVPIVQENVGKGTTYVQRSIIGISDKASDCLLTITGEFLYKNWVVV